MGNEHRHDRMVQINVYFLVVVAVLGLWAAFVTGVDFGRTWSSSGTAQTAAGPAGAAATQTGPFSVGKRAPLTAYLVTPDGRLAKLATGQRATIILAMGTWCLYCGYMDKWVLPDIAHMPRVAVDIVDVSTYGGIADPGPRNPPFSGSDGARQSLSTLGAVEENLRRYIDAYHMANSGVHFYVAPLETQSHWHISGLPTVAIADSQGLVAFAQAGGMTSKQLTGELEKVFAK